MQTIIKEISVKSVITKSNLPIADYSVNPYVGCTHACKYCYASFMKRFTNHPEPWGDFIDVKYWPVIKDTKKYEGKEFFIGSVTDPYNKLEEVYKRTREFLEEVKDCSSKISIQTKSDLVLRDLDILKSIKNLRVGFSINTLDESFRKDMDNAVSIERRLNAMKVLYDQKIRTTCFISPIFPGITDVQAIIEKVQDQCNLIWLENLNLRGSYKPLILEYIDNRYPELKDLYHRIYCKGDNSYWENLDKELYVYAKNNHFNYIRNTDIEPSFGEKPNLINFFYHEKIKKSAVRN